MWSTTKVLVIAYVVVSSIAYDAVSQDLQLDRGAVGSYLRLKELQTNASVLHVVAHPDDEDGAMLAYCARGLGARTMLFSITRGEGGANLISSHFFDELGALRTLEHQKAASYYGIQLFYSRAADYGYSKTLDEAMRQWQNGIPVLQDLVEVIRRERPTVLLSRFAGDPRDGHGHHQMAGVVSRLAFEAAADPTQFPEQLERGLQTWQVKKLYVRAGSPWRAPNEGEWTIALPTGTYDPVIGRTYAQIARFGLGFQRSQGISGHDGDPGPQTSWYRLAKVASGDVPQGQESSLFQGLDVSLSSMISPTSPILQTTRDALESMEAALRDAFEQWDATNPTPTVTELTEQLQQLRATPLMRDHSPENAVSGAASSHVASPPNHALALDELRRLERKLEEAIVAVAGLSMDAWATRDDDQNLNFAINETIQIHTRLANQSAAQVTASRLAVISDDAQPLAESAPNVKVEPETVWESNLEVRPRTGPTRPHWSRPTIAQPIYDIRPGGAQRPSPNPTFHVKLSAEIGNTPITLQSPVEIKTRHPQFGQVRYPLEVVPELSVRFSADAAVITEGTQEYRLPVVVKSSRAVLQGRVRLELPDGWSTTQPPQDIVFAREGEERTVEFVLRPPNNASASPHLIRAVATSAGKEYREGFETVTARDLKRMNLYHDAIHRVSMVDVTVAGDPQVGYIAGSGDRVAESLSAIGVNPTMLSTSDLANGDLSRFDVIIVGVRAYAVREDIRTHNSRLLEFVKRGGTLIVQYQTPEFDENFGPYPYSMGRRPEEVSEEDATVTILAPDHPVFTVPNRITAADFDGWFEQRGSKFWSTWDDQYRPLLECHDTGQAPQTGGMLVARYGAGHYVYSAYAWYRQLPNGVAGAYRIFANMLSLPETNSN